MILLEVGNRILEETVLSQFSGPEEEDEEGKKVKKKREPMDVRLCDFDDVSYRLVVDAKARDVLTVSMQLPCYRDIKDRGATDAFKKAFGESVTPADGYDVAISVNLESTPEAKREEIAKNISKMKSITVGGVFKYFFEKLKAGGAGEQFKFDLRRDTTIFFVPDKERVTIIFALDFNERVDKVVAKVFMQEFVDARKKLGFAPPVAFGVQPPAELAKWDITENTRGSLGYVSFVILPSHVKGDELIDKITATLQSFRNYIQYHIKCSKSYFHSRMRARVVTLLKVLNRAKIIDPEKDKEAGKKTISGKTFRRAK